MILIFILNHVSNHDFDFDSKYSYRWLYPTM